jgi:hypothetical protein
MQATGGCPSASDESLELADVVSLSPKRKRREGKIPLVESEVRRSHRLFLLNVGYKNMITMLIEIA